MRCSNCGTENDVTNSVCITCGTNLKNSNGKDNLLKNKAFIIAVISVVLVAIVFSINLFIIPKQAETKMNKAFDSKIGGEVVSVFTDYCGDYDVNYNELSKSGKMVYDAFKEHLERAYDDLNSISVDTIINDYLLETTGDIIIPQEYSALTTIAQYNDDLNSMVTGYYALYTSKISFQTANEEFKSKNYLNSYNYYMNVVENDNWYDDAQKKSAECQEKLLEEKIETIKVDIKNKEYDNALQEINNLRYENLTEEMSKKLDEYEDLVYEEMLKVIDDYVESGKIDEAKTYIEELDNGLSGKAQERFNKAIENRANDYIKKAKEALKSGEREGAYDMALMAQTLCPNDKKIESKVKEFKEYLPFEFCYRDNTLSQQGSDYNIHYNMKVTSNNSKTFNPCILIGYDFEINGLIGSTSYVLEGDYDYITGTGLISDYSKDMPQESYFEIYGDGKKLYKSNVMGINFLPHNFKVNLNHAKNITIKYYSSTTYGWYGVPVRYAIANLEAYKNLPKN